MMSSGATEVLFGQRLFSEHRTTNGSESVGAVRNVGLRQDMIIDVKHRIPARRTDSFPE